MQLLSRQQSVAAGLARLFWQSSSCWGCRLLALWFAGGSASAVPTDGASALPQPMQGTAKAQRSAVKWLLDIFKNMYKFLKRGFWDSRGGRCRSHGGRDQLKQEGQKGLPGLMACSGWCKYGARTGLGILQMQTETASTRNGAGSTAGAAECCTAANARDNDWDARDCAAAFMHGVCRLQCVQQTLSCTSQCRRPGLWDVLIDN
jgi:hypothetical protein